MALIAVQKSPEQLRKESLNELIERVLHRSLSGAIHRQDWFCNKETVERLYNLLIPHGWRFFGLDTSAPNGEWAIRVENFTETQKFRGNHTDRTTAFCFAAEGALLADESRL